MFAFWQNMAGGAGCQCNIDLNFQEARRGDATTRQPQAEIAGPCLERRKAPVTLRVPEAV